MTYELVGKQAPRLLPASDGEPPKASAVVINHAVQRQDARHVDWLGEIFELAVYKSIYPSLAPKEKPICPPF